MKQVATIDRERNPRVGGAACPGFRSAQPGLRLLLLAKTEDRDDVSGVVDSAIHDKAADDERVVVLAGVDCGLPKSRNHVMDRVTDPRTGNVTGIRGVGANLIEYFAIVIKEERQALRRHLKHETGAAS